jgi:short-subunit dehydrogenase/dTDP-D-glucose 4,6-dehydratase
LIVFVTGASGFVGRVLVRKLLQRLSSSDRIYALVRNEDSRLDEDPRLVNLYGVLENIAVHSEILSRCSYVYHVGAIARFSGRFDYTAINYDATRNIVDILAKSDALENLIFVSSIGAVDRARGDDCTEPITTPSRANPRSEYGKSKLRAEEYVRASRVPCTIVRPSWVYGPAMRSDSHINRFVSMVKSKALATRIRFPGRVSVIHVEDLCEALANALGRRKIIGNTYFATTESVPLHEIFESIHEHLKHRTRMLPPPPLVWIFQRFHHLLPLSIAALFLDYLWAEDPSFSDDFGLLQPIRLKDGIRQVIDTNVDWSGWWVVTGANSGIGLALARTLLSKGERVVAIDKSTDNLSATEHLMVVKADLTDEHGLQDLVAARLLSIPIKCIVNNAGVGFRGDLHELSLSQLKDTIDVNVRAPVLLTRILARHLIKCTSTIVNIASSVAVSPLPHMSVYAASKAFLASWSIALAEELRNSNAVVTVFPAGTATDFQSKAGVRGEVDGGLLDPSYVAPMILKAVARRQPIVMIGSRAKITAIVSRLLPYSLAARLWGKAFELKR